MWCHSTGLTLYFTVTFLGHFPGASYKETQERWRKLITLEWLKISATHSHIKQENGRTMTSGMPSSTEPAVLLLPGTLTCLSKHWSQQLADYGAPLPHFALFAVGEVGDDPNDVPGTGSLQCIGHDQQFHDSSIHISRRFQYSSKY